MAKISEGTVHKLTPNLKKFISSDPKLLTIWESLTELARNEWICYIESAKKEETRVLRMQKAKSKMFSGMRRPCCWAGCPHR